MFEKMFDKPLTPAQIEGVVEATREAMTPTGRDSARLYAEWEAQQVRARLHREAAALDETLPMVKPGLFAKMGGETPVTSGPGAADYGELEKRVAAAFGHQLYPWQLDILEKMRRVSDTGREVVTIWPRIPGKLSTLKVAASVGYKPLQIKPAMVVCDEIDTFAANVHDWLGQRTGPHAVEYLLNSRRRPRKGEPAPYPRSHAASAAMQLCDTY